MAPRPEEIELTSADGIRLAGLRTAGPVGAPGVVLVHGLASRKENHADMAELLAERGLATLTVDLRGHGASEGEIGPGMLDDVLAALDRLAEEGHRPLGLRGSSLGGFLALHAATRHAEVRAVAAICPATPAGLAARTGAEWPLEMPLEATIVPGDRVARAIWHAMGDEVVPWSASQALANLAPEEVGLHLVPGGGHRTLQHDPAIMDAVATHLVDRLAGPA